MRDVERWKQPIYFFDSAEDFFIVSNFKDGLYSLRYPNTYIDMIFRSNQQPSDTLIICFHGAIERNAALPCFQWMNVTKNKGYNLFISDPCLYFNDEVKLAWYAGATNFLAQKELQRIIEKVVQVTGLRKVVFMGSSGGGFAALYYGSFFPGSLVIAVNPQTDLTKYFYFKKYFQKCYGKSSEEFSALTPFHSNVGKLYKEKFINHVIYIQNYSDLEHVEPHLYSFLDEVHLEKSLIKGAYAYKCSENMGVIIGKWGEGHVPPSTDKLDSFVSNIINWDKPDFKGILSRNSLCRLAASLGVEVDSANLDSTMSDSN